MKKSPINKKTRFKIYRQALKCLNDPTILIGHTKFEDLLSGFCKLFTDSAGLLGYIDIHSTTMTYTKLSCIYYDINNYPEILKYDPGNVNFWFPDMSYYNEGIEIRKQILKEILYENKKVKNQTIS